MKSFEATLATGVPTDLMVRLKSKAGETLWFKASAGRMLSPKTGKPIAIIGCVKDQTEQKRLEQQLIDLATFDSLTGVYNRKVLMDRLSHVVKRAKRYDKSFPVHINH